MLTIVFITLLSLDTKVPTLKLLGAFPTYAECKKALNRVQLPLETLKRMDCMVVRIDPERESDQL